MKVGFCSACPREADAGSEGLRKVVLSLVFALVSPAVRWNLRRIRDSAASSSVAGFEM